MGAACNKPINDNYQYHDNHHHHHDTNNTTTTSTVVSLPATRNHPEEDDGDVLVEPTSNWDRSPSKRLQGAKDTSLFRVGSLILSSSRRRFSGTNQNHTTNGTTTMTPNKKAANYDHVHDAVMRNFDDAGVLQQESMGVPAGVVGLRNLGNTCFINSSLQCLSNTIPLTDYFLGYDYRKEINRDNFLGTGGKLATAYAELMKDMWLKQSHKDDRRIVQPSSFKRSLSTFAPQFGGNRQHDAQELLSYLLDGIHEDLNRVKKRPYVEDKDCDGSNDEVDAQNAWANYLMRNKSLVVDIFQGQFRNTCVCKECGHQNIRFEPSMYLSLPIADSCRSLEDCLRLFLEKDELTGDNQWYCEKCKKHTDASKKTDLWVLPPILIIHLKRFKHDDFGRAGRKNEAVLKYPIAGWDLSKTVKSQGGGTPTYDLYAVSNHLGGLGGGHYTAYALNRFDDQWYEFNDSKYSRIDPKTTFEQSSSPYLLFYNRVPALIDDAHPSKPRGIVIRRQSVSRPELWPHAQVREGQFRDFHRSNTHILASNSNDTTLDLVPQQENGQHRPKKQLRGPSHSNLSNNEQGEDQEMKPARPVKKKKKRRKAAPLGK